MKKFATSMNITITLLTLLSLEILFHSGSVGPPAAHAKNANNCSLDGMAGTYGYTLNGFFSPSPGVNVPLGVVGTATISEQGSISNNDTLVVNGVVTENRIYSGTITLDPNIRCAGKIDYANGIKDNFVVVNSGEEIQLIQTAPEAPATTLQAVVTGSAKKH